MRALLTGLIGAVGLAGCFMHAPQQQAVDKIASAKGVEWRTGFWRHCNLPNCQQPTPKTLLILPEQPKPEAAPALAPTPAPAVEPVAPVKPTPKVAAPEPAMVFFLSASSTPTPHGVRMIRRAAKRFADAELLRVEGYTDSTGTLKTNEVIAAARAKYVAQELKRLGVQARIEIQSGGRCCYVAKNDTKAGRESNRRVEIHPVITSKEAQ